MSENKPNLALSNLHQIVLGLEHDVPEDDPLMEIARQLTTSSSSLAPRRELTDEQIKAAVDFICDTRLGGE